MKMQLKDLLEHWRPGSQDPPWTWHDEHAELTTGTGRALTDWLREQIKVNGIYDPIILGHDGRVWDGHHRVIIARQLGIREVLVDLVPHPWARLRHHE